MTEGFHPHEHSTDPKAGPKKDCGCGCNGSGDCEEAKKPQNRARRSFLLGTGTTALATLVNHRAFAQNAVCGPLSHAASLAPSAAEITSQCGGLTPGYWANSEDVAGKVLGCPASVANACGDGLKNYLSGITLGSKLPALVTLDPTSAALNFCNVWPTPRGNAGFHWAGAILCAMSPQYNPNYGYTLGSLNQAIKDAVANGLSASQILTAIESLENDYNTSGPGGATGTNCKPCVSA